MDETRGTVWAVGSFENVATGNEDPLLLRGDGGTFRVVDGPNPNGGTDTDISAAVAATGDTVWVVGHYANGGGRLTLAQRHTEP